MLDFDPLGIFTAPTHDVLLPVDEGDYMSDQDAHEPRAGEKIPELALINLPEFGRRVMLLRIQKGWKTAVPLVEALARYADENRLARTITRDSLYRLERGVQHPDADQVLLLAAVFADVLPPEGIAYLLPRRRDLDSAGA